MSKLTIKGQQYSEARCVYKIPEGFEFEKVEEGEIILKPKKKELPKTYGECCEVLGINDLPYMAYTWNRNEDVEVVLLEPQVTLLQQLEVLRKLIVCRDAYWKLAGEEMRLGGPWKNDCGEDGDYDKFFITNDGGMVCSGVTIYEHYILVFPTGEMRGTFYENFKDWICECKELL